MSNVTYNGAILEKDSWDSKPMHDFGDNTTWADSADSTFMIQPPEDEIWVVHSVRMRSSVNANFVSPMRVEYYIHGEMVSSAVPVKAKETVYENYNAFIRRFNKIGLLNLAGNGPYAYNIFDFQYDFDEPIILKGTFDPQGPGLISFSMKIDDHQPIKASLEEGETGDPKVIEIAEVVYPEVAIYKIPEAE